MLCPDCGREFQQGYIHCSQCGVDLVYESTEEDFDDSEYPDDPKEFVEIYSTHERSEIEYLKSIFDSTEIKYYIKVDIMRGRDQLIQPATVFVHEGDLEVAFEILRDSDISS